MRSAAYALLLLGSRLVHALPTADKPVTNITCHSHNDAHFASHIKVLSDVRRFCMEAVKQGRPDGDYSGIRRTYDAGRQDEVELAIKWEPNLDWTPTLKDCWHMNYQVVDHCVNQDHPDQKETPGGTLVVVHQGKEITYIINVKAMPYTKGTCELGMALIYNNRTEPALFASCYRLLNGKGERVGGICSNATTKFDVGQSWPLKWKASKGTVPDISVRTRPRRLDSQSDISLYHAQWAIDLEVKVDKSKWEDIPMKGECETLRPGVRSRDFGTDETMCNHVYKFKC